MPNWSIAPLPPLTGAVQPMPSFSCGGVRQRRMGDSFENNRPRGRATLRRSPDESGFGGSLPLPVRDFPAAWGVNDVGGTPLQTAPASVTRRSVLVGLAGVVLLSLATPYTDLVLQGSRLCAAHLPIGSLLIFTLGLLTWNAFACRVAPRLALAPQELLVAYSMMLFCAAIPSAGLAGFLFSVMAAPFYFADHANDYERLFWHHIPNWFAPHDRQLATAFYVGLKSGQSLNWLPWLVPTLVWTGFAVVYFFSVFCLGVLLRRQWAEAEKLTFPLAQVPLNMVGIESGKKSERVGEWENGGGRPLAHSLAPPLSHSFFLNRLLWAGFALPLLVHSLNSLHHYNPAFPAIQFLRLPIGQSLTEPPLDALADLKLIFHFSIIGIGFLISSEVTLSFWVFEIIYLIQLIAFRVYGLSGGSITPASVLALTRAEEMGAFLVLATLYFKPVIRQIRLLFTQSWQRRAASTSEIRNPKSEMEEPLPPRLAALGFIGGTLLLCGFLVAAGMNPVWAVALFVIWYSVLIVLSRLVSAGGVLMVECSFMPWDVMMRTVGFHGVGVRNLTLMGFPQQMFMFDQDVIPLPYTLDAFKIMSSANVSPRQFTRALWTGFGVALIVSLVTTFVLVHRHGAINLSKWFMTDEPGWPQRKIAGWLVQPFSTDWTSLQFMTVGGLVTFILYQLHRRFLWFPLNPLGFVMASTSTLREMWFSLFIGWLFHIVVLRYFGHKAYRLLRPFFLGLILGEFLTAGLWLIVDAIMGVQGHSIFPA